jgi:hypothetical protein
MPAASVDYIYWTFSSAAQSISAFVGFLVAGYAIVQGLMESAKDRDDTLDEVHASLRRSYHQRLAVIAWLTGAAIVLSLAVVYSNRPSAPVNGWGLLAVAAVDLAAIVAGLHFVVTMIDPGKYQSAAQKVIAEKPPPSGISAASEFFDAFLHLERLVRGYLKQRDLYVPSRGAPRMSFSFREMVEALRANEMLPGTLYRELMEINKYRNLVFHGHVSEVDIAMLHRVREATREFEALRGA